VTVPVGNWAAEPTVAARGSEVGPQIGISDINHAMRGGGRLDGQSNAPRSVPALSTARSISCRTCGAQGRHTDRPRQGGRDPAADHAEPQRAYALTCDTAQKSFRGNLEVRGLRAASKVGYVVHSETAPAQFDPPLGELIGQTASSLVSRIDTRYAAEGDRELPPQGLGAFV
jgi:hypothetical protein